jgi:hypothetical protein
MLELLGRLNLIFFYNPQNCTAFQKSLNKGRRKVELSVAHATNQLNT